MLLHVTLPARSDTDPPQPPRILGITWDHPKVLRATPTDLTMPGGAAVLEVQERRATVCVIYEVDAATGKPEKEVSKAVLNCYFRDRFEREVGRKLTLRRALVFTNLNREERGVVWHAYHARPRITGVPRTPRLPVHAVTADMHAGEV